jgi:uncharacterized FAD-dependent dehydrogenase
VPVLVANRPEGEDLATWLGVPVRSAVRVRRTLDARARPPAWRVNWRAEVEDEAALLARGLAGVRAWSARDEARWRGDVPAVRVGRWARRPLVVGAGPAGLFAALRLAEAGAPVLLLERGEPVESRVRTVHGTWRAGTVNPESNVLFGEGGAGTFSDGKVYTRRRDGELGWIFRVLVECGADASILEEGWAHLGTDRVRAILPVLRARLVAAGGEVRFGAAVERFLVEGGRCTGVALRGGEEVRGAPTLVAPGHSARDTLRAMVAAGASAEARPIAIGARVEHPQAMVDRARYRGERGELPAASYRLAHNPPDGRSAWTFCMCPGGMVVPAGAEPDGVVVNGMSFAARSAKWANSAVVVRVPVEDYGRAGDPLAGLGWQAAIEQAAFRAGGGAFVAPAQRVIDFLAGRPSESLPQVSYPHGARPSDVAALLPRAVVAGMRDALRAFDRELPGFAGAAGVLIAPETRTTCPVRFHRDAGYQSPTLRDLVPVGEGAGWAGGIVSAALDGMRAAEAVIAGVGVH